MTFLEHATKWGNGCGAFECSGARHVVLARGTVPCDVVFVGEAPGISEDSIGLPFQGPAGHLFDQGPDSILARAYEMAGCLKSVETSNPSYAVCNLVACMPRDADGRKTSDLLDAQVVKCSPRLVEFLEMCSPRLIVTLGSLSEVWLDPKQRHGIKLPASMSRVLMVSVTHPSAILRAKIVEQSRMVNNAIAVITSALREVTKRGPG